jgi:hypothetical protein
MSYAFGNAFTLWSLTTGSATWTRSTQTLYLRLQDTNTYSVHQTTHPSAVTERLTSVSLDREDGTKTKLRYALRGSSYYFRTRDIERRIGQAPPESDGCTSS